MLELGKSTLAPLVSWNNANIVGHKLYRVLHRPNEWPSFAVSAVVNAAHRHHHHHIFVYLEVVKRNSYKTQA